MDHVNSQDSPDRHLPPVDGVCAPPAGTALDARAWPQAAAKSKELRPAKAPSQRRNAAKKTATTGAKPFVTLLDVQCASFPPSETSGQTDLVANAFRRAAEAASESTHPVIVEFGDDPYRLDSELTLNATHPSQITIKGKADRCAKLECTGSGRIRIVGRGVRLENVEMLRGFGSDRTQPLLIIEEPSTSQTTDSDGGS